MCDIESFENNERLDSIEVQVIEADPHFTSSLSWRLTVENADGEQFEVKIWNTHDVRLWWREGWRYLLKEGRIRRQNGKIILHSTKDFSVRYPDDTTVLLAIGDTHIGREQRPGEAGPPYRTGQKLIEAFGYAVRYNVDAVLHTGDFFDDEPGPEDLAIAQSAFEILAQHKIPFYYILGNHGQTTAGEFYADRNVTAVGTDGVCIDDNIEIFGVDYESPTDFSVKPTEFDLTPGINHQLLLLHQEVSPPRDNSPVDMELISDPARIEFDCVIAGHLHAPESGEWRGSPVQHLGSTANLSTKKSANDESAWLLRVTPEEIHLERIGLDPISGVTV